MAAFIMTSALICKNAITNISRPRNFVSRSMTKATTDQNNVDLPRRTGNYQPSLWDHRSLLSIETKHTTNEKVTIRDLLKKKVRKMLDVKKNHLEQLELIDDLQKLGVSYHFEQEINKILTDLHEKNVKYGLERNKEEDTHAISLEFRLLRQNGSNVSEDIFDGIVEKLEGGTFKSADLKSLISLYEASYLAAKSDTKLRKIIRPFAIEKLKEFVDNAYNSEEREMAIQALEMPYHWRMRRLETRRYIDESKKKHHGINRDLLEFAIYDFNTVQIAYQKEIKDASSWWEDTCLGKQLPFVRDRIVENYFWSVGYIYQPQFGFLRRIMTMGTAFTTTIDDIYDVYGTLEELEIFTDIVDNWDVNRLDELPEYMRSCFLILYNEINGIGCEILKSKNTNVIPFLRKSWADLCKAYLVEAKWYKKGYKPSMKEYMQNGLNSSTALTLVMHMYCVLSDQISIQMLESLSHLARCSSIVFRLANDLGTSSDELARGDTLKSLQCYMNETGASEEEARAHIQQMIGETWDEINDEIKSLGSSTLVSWDLVEASMNTARIAQCIYQHGDGHGDPENAKTVERVQALILNPIPFD